MSPPSLRSGKHAATEKIPTPHGSDGSESDETTTEETIKQLRREIRELRARLADKESATAQPAVQTVAVEEGTSRPDATDKARHTQEWVDRQADPVDQVIATLAEAIHRRNQTGGSQGRSTPGPEDARMAAFIARQAVHKDLPEFSGSPLEWKSFKGQFEQSTELCGLSPAENLLRLQRALKGRAREAVAALLVDPRNVFDVIRNLEVRFGRPEMIVDTMLAKIRRLPHLTADTGMEDVVEYGVAIRNVVAAVEGIDPEYLSSPQLLTEMASKMPAWMRFMWSSSRRGKPKATIKDLADWLMEEGELASAAGTMMVATPAKASRPAAQQSSRGPARPRRETTMAIRETTDDHGGKCVLCYDETHSLPGCEEYLKLSVKNRWNHVRDAKLCYVCLAPDHQSFRCKRQRCGESGCKRSHHKTLHEERGTDHAANVMCCWGRDEQVYLKVVPIKVRGPKGEMETYALLDEGSTTTLIDDSIAKKIGARGPVEGVNLHGVANSCRSDGTSRRVRLSMQGGGVPYTVYARTIKELNLPPQCLSELRMCKGGPTAVRPGVLIGQDNAHLIVSRETRDRPDKRIMSRTALGWTIHGGPAANGDTVLLTSVAMKPDASLDKLIRLSFSIDSLGVTTGERVNREEARAMHIMQATTRALPGGQWETGLLWRREGAWLPSNYQCARKRLLQLERRLQGNDSLRTAYKAKIDDYLRQGYAVRVTAEEMAAPCERRWYLAHFAVTHPRKPGKIRVVFDAASDCRGTSLNKELMAGPDLLSSLLGNILRFREGKFAVAADIKDMFLRIKIREEDQSSQLFLWRDTPEAEVNVYKFTSMMFGAKCSPSSAQYVRNRVAADQEERYPAAARSVRSNFYMDDYLEAFDEVQEAAARAREVRALLARGGFDLINWASNEARALRALPTSARAEAGHTIDIAKAADMDRVLGVRWDARTDTFQYDLRSVCGQQKTCPTKRTLLSEIMSIFDPLGLVACLTIRTRILLQEVWRSKIHWDEYIKPEHALKWKQWVNIATARIIQVPRCCIESRTNTRALHVFCDASELACCAVAYLVEDAQQGKKVSFGAAKCKVAPLTPLSVPRLELQAAVIGARLATTMKKELSCRIHRTYMWTDSSTVLTWIRTDPRRYSTFAANRLGEIDELTEAADWRWVPTKLNPADIGTRDTERPDLTARGLWYSGPAFLRQPEGEWPKERTHQPDDAALEVKARYCGVAEVRIEIATPAIERFSSWRRLLRATGWMLKFVARCRRGGTRGTELTAEELEEAETLLVKRSQAAAFDQEIAAIRRGEGLPASSRLHALAPELDARGVLRVGTRLRALEGVATAVAAPIILDGNKPYTRLLVQHYHEQVGHGSTERTMSDMREYFHVLRMRGTLRRLIHECAMCKVRRSKPCPPLMGPLPQERLDHHQPPFHSCGVDYFGPMMVVIGRRREKRYGVLFTCLTTRAVHIEVAASLSCDAAIMAIQRMTARRGQPQTFFSDNGTNLRGAEKEMRLAIADLAKTDRLVREMGLKGSVWKFIPPASPHMGGAWERLVRSVKTALAVTLKERAPREETLLTALAEAEYTVNSRPLTHVSVDPRDEQPLTPNHFLIGTAGGRPHLALYRSRDNEVCLRKQWRIAQRLADHFWRRWVKEYLPTLAQRQKWKERVTPLKVDDLVVITDSTLPRNSWPRGRITEVHTAEDGQVRSVKVRTAKGTYERPAVKIAAFPL